ncbi:MAG TPA: PEGA domain-containing protein, partial [Methanoculleus sp.]|nr:PEGA domain-containing protein [Methanoculleus sp.]
ADGAEPVEETILLDHDDEVFIEFPGAGTSPAGPLRTWEQNHYGGVYVDSFPAGADILVDGQKVNRKTPDIVYGLKEGLHTIKLRKENTAFSSEKEQVWVERNTITRVTFASGNADLVRSITFDSEDCAQKPFSVNGRYLGDRLPKKVDVRGIGGAYITVRDSESYRSYRIPATAGSNDTVTVTLPDAPCSLLVTSVPAGAAIAVDGFLTGFATPYVIENISEGKHRIAVSKPGHIPAEREVLLTDGSGDTTVKVTLEPYVWGSLAVSSTPPDAKIYLFGRDTGEVTPHTFHYLDIGSYPVKVVGKEGSKTIEGVLVSPHAVAGCHADLTGE